jgi:hypothetical protein
VLEKEFRGDEDSCSGHDGSLGLVGWGIGVPVKEWLDRLWDMMDN